MGDFHRGARRITELFGRKKSDPAEIVEEQTHRYSLEIQQPKTPDSVPVALKNTRTLQKFPINSEANQVADTRQANYLSQSSDIDLVSEYIEDTDWTTFFLTREEREVFKKVFIDSGTTKQVPKTDSQIYKSLLNKFKVLISLKKDRGFIQRAEFLSAEEKIVLQEKFLDNKPYSKLFEDPGVDVSELFNSGFQKVQAHLQ